MKKFLLALVALFVAGAVSADTILNTPGFKGAPTDKNILVEVYNGDSNAVENGDVVVYQYDATVGIEITDTTTANSPLVAGVVYPNTIAAGAYGTIMVYGYHPAVTIAVANASGDTLITSTTAEATGVFDVATSTVAYSVGTALEATTSSTTVKAFINAL